MTDWLALIDRAISIRQNDGDMPVFAVEEMSSRIIAALNEHERRPSDVKLINLCFDALVCLREVALRSADRPTSFQAVTSRPEDVG